MPFIQEIKQYPLVGIIAFIDEPNKSIYAFFSNSSFTLFCTNLCKLRSGIHENKQLQDAFNRDALETVVLKGYEVDPGSLELRSQYKLLIEQYIQNGYTDMRKDYSPIGYKLKTFILTDYRNKYIHKPLVYVVGRSRGVEEIVLGIFDSIPESEEWINSVYGSKRTELLPVFCTNQLTKDYHENNGLAIYR